MRLWERFAMDVVALVGVCFALAVPLDVRADDLSAADLEAIDRALAASSSAACAEPRDHLRSLRDAYARQEAPIVRSAIAARVPTLLETLRFCIETAGAAATATDPIEPARRALEAARARVECAEPAAGIAQLVTAWEAESSPVVRGAIETRLESLGQAARFCVEALAPAPIDIASTTTVDTTVPSSAGLPTIAPLAQAAAAPTGGRALGSPFPPAP